MKILIAEDDRFCRWSLEKLLKKMGHEVIATENGLEAWQNLITSDVRMVIADWMMPIMDGLTLCQKIRASQNQMEGYVYFILLTSMKSMENVIQGLEAGADDYIIKNNLNYNELKVRLRAGERVIILEKKLLEKTLKLEQLARCDALMQIGNRRCFYEAIEKLHAMAARDYLRYGLVMIDVDFFKAYNDTYGHQAGDWVLQAVARTLKGTLRKSDEIFRYGGEEIVVLLPGSSLKEALLAGEKIRRSVEMLRIEHKGNAPSEVVTISCGVSSYSLSENGVKEWEAVLEEADKALYNAKSKGRNCVHPLNKGSLKTV